VAVSLVAALAIAVHLIWPGLKIDAVVVALLLFGSLPWLRGIVQSISLPGGPSIDLRNYRVIAREERQTTDAVRVAGSAVDAGSVNERTREIQQQAERYEAIRREMPSGSQRTSEMGRIARQILSLLPVTGLDVSRELLSPRAGQRLIAYLSLTSISTQRIRPLVRRIRSGAGGCPTRGRWCRRGGEPGAGRVSRRAGRCGR
jgi:hypothetical protein